VVTSAGRPTEAAVEREAKLVAPDGVELPDMAGLVAGATAVELPELRLDATYYDTDDLRLARSGITLRRRDGEPGPPWTVKFPRDVEGPALARQEIRVDGEKDEIPYLAKDLVRATARTRDLVPVARLTTVRRSTEIRGNDHRPLASVVDDDVSVSSDRSAEGRFREVEVELRDPGRSSAQILDAAIARLVAVGCTAEAPIPKLVRALGEPATRPPDVVVSALTAHASVADLAGHAVARCVTQILRHDPGIRLGEDPEDVHHFRVGVRRLRSDLRSFAPLLDHAQVVDLRGELEWLGGVVGRVRDYDVLTARMITSVATLAEEDALGGALLLGYLEDNAADARTEMLQTLRGTRYMDLLETIVGTASVLPLADSWELLDKSDAQVALRIARKPWRRLAQAVDSFGPDPPDAALHRVRILAKRCRYAADAVAPIVGPAATRFADAMADVQTILGDHQDSVVAESWLRSAAAAVPTSGLAVGQLIALERSRRSELRTRWPSTWHTASSKRLRRWLRD
jgi:CHAD domain-containing protein